VAEHGDRNPAWLPPVSLRLEEAQEAFAAQVATVPAVVWTRSRDKALRQCVEREGRV
jgi:hypothetical protein